MTLTTGQIIGPYELIRELGAGAFGEVWLARHTDLNVERAVKIPTDPDYVKQLRQEGQIQFALHHPNIVQTLDLNTKHTPPYFVMEYIEGESLRQRLNTKGKLAVAEALKVLRQILEALVYAHGEGVLHRDLKPENILIQKDGTIKITDFGLGKVQAEVTRSLVLSGNMQTVEGKSVSGTYDYMSPEQRQGVEATPQDDIYALGIIGCELLTGRRPMALGLTKTLERESVPQDIIRLLEKACEEVKYRYKTAAEMLAAMESPKPSSVVQPPVVAPKVTQGPDRIVQPQVTQPKTPQQTRSSQRVRSVDQNTEAQKKRPRRKWLVLGVLGTLILGGMGLYWGNKWLEQTQARQKILQQDQTDVTKWRHRILDLGRGVKMQMVFIAPGEFLMGSNERDDEKPVHRVKITKGFWMGKYEVTQEQWEAVMGTNLSRFKGAQNPVESVSWNEVVEFCRKTGTRLPTEAEWEYACRAGTTTKYSSGDSDSDLDGVAWYSGNSGNTTHPVGQKQPNAWGLYDMYGNVWEWCADWYAGSYYQNSTGNDPTGPPSGSVRVLRGGSWFSDPGGCRSAGRVWIYPGSRFSYIGFRVCLDFP